MINIKGLSHKYVGNDFFSLYNISLNINDGDIVGLIGTNGAGKTTLIKVISGLLVPSFAQMVLVDNYDQLIHNRKERPSIGLILNSNQLYDDLTVLENIKFYLLLNKKKGDKEKILKTLKQVGLNNKENLLVKNCSTGMKQKVNIAKMILSEAKTLILDEPTSGMDPISKQENLQLLRILNKKYGTTIIISSHIISDIEKICNKLIFINSGQIIYYGEINNLVQSFSEYVYELLLDGTNFCELQKELKNGKYKYYIDSIDNFNHIIFFDDVLESTNINIYNKIIKRKTNIEDIFFYIVQKGSNNDIPVYKKDI